MKSSRKQNNIKIGNTPLCRLPASGQEPDVWLKLEAHNPGGSIKDRTAYGMITAAEASGALSPGAHIIESSSGNTAIGLAILAQRRGYQVTTICDRHLPANKRKRLEAFGANIIFLPDTPPGLDTVEIRIAVAEYLSRRLAGGITMGQYSNHANVEIHYRTTGPEIWEALDGNIAAVVVAAGTCGTISGVGRFLKERNPKIQVIAVEPVGSVIFGGEPGRYLIQGGGLSFTPPILDRSVIDLAYKVSDGDAVKAIHHLALTQGLLVGGTGGLVVSLITKIRSDYPKGANIVGIIPDSGERYLDTLFNDRWLADNRLPRLIDRQKHAAARNSELKDLSKELACGFNDSTIACAADAAERLCARLGVALVIQAETD